MTSKSLLSKILLGVIRAYQTTVSPTHGLFREMRGGPVCSHSPDCSTYAVESIRRYGGVRGFHYSAERVMSCTGGEVKTYDPSHVRVLFASGSPVGVPFLETLVCDDRFECVGLLTQPAAKSGRGQHIKQNIVENTGRELLGDSLQVFAPHSLKRSSKRRGDEASETLDAIKEINPDLILVVAYGHIVPQELLDIPYFGCINVHGSILPEYRGASPLQSVFLDEKEESGITVMQMSLGMDEGAKLDTRTTKLGINDTVQDLYERIRMHGPEFTLDTIWEFVKGRIDPTKQIESDATYCTKIQKHDGLVTVDDTLRSVFAKYKAYYRWPGIWFEYEGKRIKIINISVQEQLYNEYAETPWVDNPAISSLQVRPEGKKTMSRDDFKNGYMK